MAKCLKCGYEWKPRKEIIKSCPSCKCRNWASYEKGAVSDPLISEVGEIDDNNEF